MHLVTQLLEFLAVHPRRVAYAALMLKHPNEVDAGYWAGLLHRWRCAVGVNHGT